MNNLVEDFYKVHYAAGLLKRPIHNVFGMRNQSGKSLTTFRMQDHKHIVVLGGDITAQAIRKKLYELYKANRFDDIYLIVLEDWTKLRIKVKEPIAATLTQLATGTFSLIQEGINIEGIKTRASIVINVPTNNRQEPFKYLLDAGAGNRFKYFQTELSDEMKKELDTLGDLNFCEPLKRLEMPKSNELTIIKYIDFKQSFINNGNKDNSDEVAFAYACECLRPGLYKEFKKIDNSFIKDIQWDAWDV